jgi:hypothetical protein
MWILVSESSILACCNRDSTSKLGVWNKEKTESFRPKFIPAKGSQLQSSRNSSMILSSWTNGFVSLTLKKEKEKSKKKAYL